MELRILGPGSAPDEDLEKDLKTLFAIDAAGWDLLAKWFLTTESFDPEEALSSPAVIASTMAPERFVGSVNAVRSLLESWHRYGLKLADIQHDLMVLGFKSDQVERVGALLAQLESIRPRVHTSFVRFGHENAVLPTLEDVDVVCDVRPIFEDHVYLATTPKQIGVSHTKLLGFSYMVLVELLTEDFEGQSHKLSFQMTEETLAHFKAALQRATDQLDILKSATNGLSNKHA